LTTTALPAASAGELLRLAGDGRVPRRDGRDHAHGLVDAHGHEVAATRGRDGLFHGLAGRSEELEGAGGAGHQGARLADGLAVVEALQLGQRLGAFADQLGHAVQHGGALMGLLLGPAAGAEGMVGLLYGLLHIGQAGGTQAAHHLAGRGVERGGFVAAAKAPFAGDIDGEQF
jgi:hypothetical protein